MKSAHNDMDVTHWEKRPEAKWKDFKFNQPYEKGLTRLRDEVLAKTNFDPAVLWQWGTMQAMAVLEILKSAERKFGRDGQEMVFDGMRKVGYDVGVQITKGTTIPKGMTFEEWNSFYASIINRIAYASLESPEIESEEKVSFHIDWCPHQDHYSPFDCRVQRYFVQGMIDAAVDFLNGQGIDIKYDVVCKATIPAGSETCFFEMERADPEKARKWAEYTRQLEDKALEIAETEGKKI